MLEKLGAYLALLVELLLPALGQFCMLVCKLVEGVDQMVAVLVPAGGKGQGWSIASSNFSELSTVNIHQPVFMHASELISAAT